MAKKEEIIFGNRDKYLRAVKEVGNEDDLVAIVDVYKRLGGMIVEDRTTMIGVPEINVPSVDEKIRKTVKAGKAKQSVSKKRVSKKSK